MPMPGSARQIELGPVSFLLDGADLRYLELNGTEILRRVTVVVRDEAWGTLEPDEMEVEVSPPADDAVEIVARCTHASAAADISWTTTARITSEGRLTYATELEPRAPFPYNRMGICLLHPPSALIGSAYAAETPDGAIAGTIPAEIGPQRIEGDEIFPLFPAFSKLRIGQPDGFTLDFRFEGDLFEMEDQRNWSDGSFKTYSTPLSLPRPHHARPGQPVRQRVEVVPGDVSLAQGPKVGKGPVWIEIGSEPSGATAPGVGLFLAAPSGPSTSPAPLPPGLEHVRVDLRPSLDAADLLGRGASLADSAGASLLVALHLRDAGELAPLGEALAPYADRVTRLLVFDDGAEASPGPLAAAAREQLGEALEGARFAGGTDLWFAQINRIRPDPEAMDAVAWSITPQVHGYDSLTVMETLTAQADQVLSARAFAPGLDLFVGPVTLRPRYNPSASDAREQTLHPPPESIDPRQESPFAAAFTAGSIAQLCGAGVDSITFYEVDGPRGVLGGDGVLPCWHPIADFAAWRGWSVVPTSSPQPLAVQALALRDPEGGTTGILLANLRDRPTEVRLNGVPPGDAQLRMLDAKTEAAACADPTGFRAGGEGASVVDGSLTLELAAYGVATILAGEASA